LETPSHTFSANGKLLLTAEYAVLFGALALALPARRGQRLTVTYGQKDGLLSWTSRELGKDWFSASLRLPGLEVISSSNAALALRLSSLLQTVRQLSPDFLHTSRGAAVITDLDFPRDWGLGTSSTLIHLVSQWSGTDPYALLDATFGGSGYDIACAERNMPILYQREQGRVRIQATRFNPPFLDCLFLGFSGVKKDSGQEVRRVLQHGAFPGSVISRLSEISTLITQCTDLKDFISLMQEHEQLLGIQLGQEVVCMRFPDHDGLVKSLGAWGGDFLLFSWEGPQDELRMRLGRDRVGPVFSLDELLYTHEPTNGV